MPVHGKKTQFTGVIILTFTLTALVIKEKKMGEQDRLLTLLTAEMGVITAYAAGAGSIKSKKAAATRLLSYSDFTIDKKGERMSITEASPIELFFGVGSDVVTLALAQYFCEICLYITPPAGESAEILRLILNSLYFITRGKKNIYQIKAITELRLASVAGFMPDLTACSNCGDESENKTVYLSARDGCIVCENCRTGQGLIKLEPPLLNAMRHIVFSSFDKIYSFSLSSDLCVRLSEITEKYFEIQTEHRFKTLEFFNTVK